MISSECYLEGNFTLKSGKTSNFYLNLRNLISQPLMINDIAFLIHSYLSKNFASDFLICGLPYAGIPYASAVSILNHIPNIILRKERKTHGLGNMIDGLANTSLKKVVIIDDIITTGSSIRESIPVLLEHGLEIVGIICIVDRSESGIPNLKVNNICYPIHSLFTLGQLQDCHRNQIN
jgi:uridine monophosphate synthetase